MENIELGRASIDEDVMLSSDVETEESTDTELPTSIDTAQLEAGEEIRLPLQDYLDPGRTYSNRSAIKIPGDDTKKSKFNADYYFSDFGLAKLCEKKESIMSLLDTRGTIGYIAPEMISRVYGGVSHKSDVYSYGMLVLEMIGATNKDTVKNTTSNTSSIYFPDWIYNDLENEQQNRIYGDDLTKEEEEITKKMVLVALRCIQSYPSNRPSMNRVVEMMEGSLDALDVPPRPIFQIPIAPLRESSTLSGDISVYIEE
ncbi:hypothetical protein F2Q69_00020029 [Brassica cretica]|uniref:Protein kinase domain-containing protein n=1 Tax=Brassica cretica TaxID=69181 RepID=A0A8S9Q488_BRACR|nr:hypothetical protein F2Q69_00020029 [Brassica cretica]